MKPVSQLKPLREVTFMTFALRMLFNTATRREQERFAYDVLRNRAHFRRFKTMAANFFIIGTMAMSEAHAKAHPLPPESMPEHIKARLLASLRAERECQARLKGAK